MSYNPVTEDIVSALQLICGRENVIFENHKKLQQYSHDKVPEPNYAHMPEVIVMPTSAAETAAVMRLANEHMIPVTPRAAGSGLSGGAVPIHGGILLSVERMNRILEIDSANLMAVVEPGVVTNKLDEALSEFGLFFAGYPMSEEICFIGGNVAENAGGGRAITYGVTGRYITGLEVVTPTGDIMQLGGKRIKDVTGYDLVSLMVGSEGTLGIFTRITIKLLPRPTKRVAVLALFDDITTAIAVVPAIMTEGKLIPTAIEFMDGYSFTMAAQALRQDFPYDRLAAALLFEVDGNDDGQVKKDVEILDQVCRKNGAIARYRAETDQQISRFWKIRKQIAWSVLGQSELQSIEDVVVPIAAIPALLSELKTIGKKYDTRIPVFGHAGDGNLHATPFKNPKHSQEHWEKMLPNMLSDIYRATYALGGTISGEHGIGHKRKEYLPLVMDSAQLDLMRRIKLAFDPNDILNPGKIV